MELQIQELRNSIMEEVILKNYKLLQFVENEMKQLKEENAHLRKEIKLLKDDNTNFKDEIKLLKEENKINKNLFCNRQNIQDTLENTMIIGFDIYKQPISWNIEKAYLLSSFKECTELGNFFSFGQYIISLEVFKHLNKLNKFKTFSIPITRLDNYVLVDENLFRIDFWVRNLDNPLCLSYGELYEYHFNLLCTDVKYNHIKQNWKNLLEILDECNIKLLFNNSEKCFDKSLRDLILS